MSDEEIRDEMFTMLAAGNETTAKLLAWVVHRLTVHPDAQATARAEVVSVVGRRPDPYTFFPFGGGVRHCLGAAFATFEAKIVLARVLSRTRLRPDPRHVIRVVRRGLALGPSGDLPVIRTAI